MDDRLRLQASMAALGFDRVAIGVYAVVLTCGPLSRAAVSEILGHPAGPVDRAVALLDRAGLVGTVVRRLRRRQLYAVDPAMAWTAFGRDRAWTAGDADDASRRTRYAELAEVARRLRRAPPPAAVAAHQEWDAASRDELARLVCELIAGARRTIVAVSRSPHLPHVAWFWTALTDRLAAGVSYRRVVDLDELIAHGLAITRRDLEVHGIDLRVLEQARIDHKYYLVDGRRLAVVHGDRPGPGGVRRAGAGRLTTRATIARRYARRHRAYAAAAIPAPFVVARLEAASRSLLRQARDALTPPEVAWVASLVQLGQFSRFSDQAGWSPDDARRAVDRALAAGVVRRSAEGDVVPAYPLTEAELRAAWEAARPPRAP